MVFLKHEITLYHNICIWSGNLEPLVREGKLSLCHNDCIWLWHLIPNSSDFLSPEEAFDKLPQSTVPEMQRSNLAPVILQLKALGIDNVLRFHFMSVSPAFGLRPWRGWRAHRGMSGHCYRACQLAFFLFLFFLSPFLFHSASFPSFLFSSCVVCLLCTRPSVGHRGNTATPFPVLVHWRTETNNELSQYVCPV